MSYIIKILKRPGVQEFSRYVAVGGLATVADWGTFYVFSLEWKIDFHIAFVVAFIAGTTTHYCLNKRYTFKNTYTNLKKHIPVYLLSVCFAFLMSFLLMKALVSGCHLHLMVAKMSTTASMLILNYVLHKYITFNKRFFS